jgi:uncharacterized protein (TIGR00251 family)
MKKATRPEGALLPVRVQPRAGRDEVAGWHGHALRVRVAAPPVGGRANQAVIALLAEALGLPRSSIEVVSGDTSRDKLVRVGRRSLAEIRALLNGARQ